MALYSEYHHVGIDAVDQSHVDALFSRGILPTVDAESRGVVNRVVFHTRYYTFDVDSGRFIYDFTEDDRCAPFDLSVT
jgi:hypothetical protein